MKKVRIILSLLLCVMMVASFPVSVAATNEVNSEFALEVASERSTIEYNALLKYYAKGALYYTSSTIDYPNWYGGAYVNEQQELIINVTELTDAIKNELIKITGNPDLIIKVVDYSYEELLAAQDLVDEKMIQSKGLYVASSSKVIATGLSMKNNSVNVYAKGVDSEDKTLLTNILPTSEASLLVAGNRDLSSIPVRILPGHEIEEAATIGPGGNINNYNNSDRKYRSVGFWGYDSSGNLGVVTSPHNTMSLNGAVNIDDVTFGVLTSRAFSGSVDAGFVRRSNSSFTPSNTLTNFGVTIIARNFNSAVEGQQVRMQGAYTARCTGTVVEDNYTASYSGVTLNDLVLFNGSVQSGDSGSAVIGPNAASGRAYLVGVLCARDISTNYGVYCKAGNVFSALGLSVYTSPWG